MAYAYTQVRMRIRSTSPDTPSGRECVRRHQGKATPELRRERLGWCLSLRKMGNEKWEMGIGIGKQSPPPLATVSFDSDNLPPAMAPPPSLARLSPPPPGPPSRPASVPTAWAACLPRPGPSMSVGVGDGARRTPSVAVFFVSGTGAVGHGRERERETCGGARNRVSDLGSGKLRGK